MNKIAIILGTSDARADLLNELTKNDESPVSNLYEELGFNSDYYFIDKDGWKIWDTPGDKQFFDKASIVIAVIDMNNKESFSFVKEQVDSFKKSSMEKPVLVLIRNREENSPQSVDETELDQWLQNSAIPSIDAYPFLPKKGASLLIQQLDMLTGEAVMDEKQEEKVPSRFDRFIGSVSRLFGSGKLPPAYGKDGISVENEPPSYEAQNEAPKYSGYGEQNDEMSVDKDPSPSYEEKSDDAKQNKGPPH